MQRIVSHPPDRPDLTDESDMDLLEYAAMRGSDLAGDELALVEEAFAELYRRHAESIFQLIDGSAKGEILTRLLGPSAVKAVVNDTFLRACERGDTYDPMKAQVRTWLVRVAKNLVNDRLRAEQKRVDGRSKAELESDDFETAISLPSLMFDNETEADPELVEIILDAMDEAITDREYELMIKYLSVQRDGSTPGRADRGAVKQAAATLDTTPGNLRSTTSRAIKKMKAYVRERMPDRVLD